MISDNAFWQALTKLIQTNSIMIDRPKGSLHPRFPELVYPFHLIMAFLKIQQPGMAVGSMFG